MFQHCFRCPATFPYPPPLTSLLQKKLKGCAGGFAASRAAFSFSVDQNCWSGPGCAANTAVKAQVRAPRLRDYSPCGRYSAGHRGTDQAERYGTAGQGWVSVKPGANGQPSPKLQAALGGDLWGGFWGCSGVQATHALADYWSTWDGPQAPLGQDTELRNCAPCWLRQPAIPISWVHPLPPGEQEPCHPSAQCGTCPWWAGGGPTPNGALWSSDSGSRAPTLQRLHSPRVWCKIKLPP